MVCLDMIVVKAFITRGVSKQLYNLAMAVLNKVGQRKYLRT